MTRRRKRLLFVGVPSVLVLLLFLSVALPMSLRGSAQKRRIETMVINADRVVIDPNLVPGLTRGQRITVTGKRAVADLLERIEFKTVFIRAHCMCFGEVALRFGNADRELLVLTFHHGQSLRVHDANWAHNPNFPLTEQSRIAVAGWLQKHGYRPPTTTASAPE